MAGAGHERGQTSDLTLALAGEGPRRRSRPAVLSAIPFLLPALVFYGIFVIYPMLTAVQLSLYEWNGLSGSPMTYVGGSNYERIFVNDPVFWTAFRNSLIW